MKTTERGFGVYADFTDRYDNQVRVQESSLATEPAIWIFCEPSEREARRYREIGIAPSPHLTIEMAKLVRDALTEFIARSEA
jgi:hypothetical protein